ncbi:MAG: hypothetical protein MPN21_26325 [Thermoanaerobaculia bacterium]|nr:hypothetical protein [Thermoanaerobaculia bacterium]
MAHRVNLVGPIVRTLRAFLWLRWRLMVNGLVGGRGRDAMAFFAAWAGVLVRGILGLLLLGAIVALSLVAAVLAGKLAGPAGLASEAAILGFRVVLGVLSVVLVLFPLMTRSGGDLAAAQRLRLLPVRDRRLDQLDMVGAFADPWLMAISPIPLVVTAVLWWHGRWAGGAVALVGGLLMLASLALASTVTRRFVGWVLRDRRRAQLAALTLVFGVVVLSASAIRLERLLKVEGSGVVKPEESEVEGSGVVKPEEKVGVEGEAEAPAHQAAPKQPLDEARDLRKISRHFPAGLQVLPSELFVRALVYSLEGTYGLTLVLLVALAALPAMLLLVARRLWRATVGSPGVSGRARVGSLRLASLDRFPGLTPAATAVAWVQVCTAVRSLYGKLALAMPTVAMLIIVVPLQAALAGEENVFLRSLQGPPLALGAVAFAILGIQPFALNQFAADGEGLARQLLVPLRSRDLILGKAIGLGVLVGLSTLVGILATVASVGRGSVAVWLAILLTALPVYLLMAPLSFILSLYFPKAMDLDGLGHKSKPHQLAALLGLVAVAGVLSLIFSLVGLGIGFLGTPWWTVFAILVLALGAAVAALVFLHYAAPVLPARTEAILAAIRER